MVTSANLRTVISPLIGHLCWAVGHDPQFGLSLNFGRPVVRVLGEIPARKVCNNRRRVSIVDSTIGLRIFRGWLIVLEDGTVVSARSRAPLINLAAKVLKGQVLAYVAVTEDVGATTFKFDLGARIEVMRPKSQREVVDLWELYLPRDRGMTVTSNGQWREGRLRHGETVSHPIRGVVSVGCSA